MREIKFRAWDFQQKEMVSLSEPEYRVDPHGFVMWELHRKPHERTDYDFVLMQFTGLRDKHGKEIYEGDVVDFCTGKGPTCRLEIIFDEGAFKVIPHRPRQMVVLSFVAQEAEVIGNIYETPELLVG